MRYIKYVGLSHQRIITATDWRRAGISEGETVIWNAQNGFAIPLDKLTEEQVRLAIDPDSSFVVTGDDEDFTPTPQNQDMVPAEAAAAAENPVDVLAMANGDDNVSPATSEASGGVARRPGLAWDTAGDNDPVVSDDALPQRTTKKK